MLLTISTLLGFSLEPVGPWGGMVVEASGPLGGRILATNGVTLWLRQPSGSWVPLEVNGVRTLFPQDVKVVSVPNPSIMFYGVFGMMVSDNWGSTFQEAVGVSADLQNGVFSEKDSLEVYFAGYRPSASPPEIEVYRSTDGGSTWEKRSTLTLADAPPNSILALKGDTVVMGTGSDSFGSGAEAGLSVSYDGGVSWQRIALPPISGNRIADLELLEFPGAGSGRYLLVGMDDRILVTQWPITNPYSPDWSSISLGVTSLARYASQGDTVFFLASAIIPQGVLPIKFYETTPGSLAWEIEPMFYDQQGVSEVLISGDSVILGTAGFGFVATTDGGASWVELNQDLSMGLNYTAFSLLGNWFMDISGVLWRSDDGGLTWSPDGVDALFFGGGVAVEGDTVWTSAFGYDTVLDSLWNLAVSTDGGTAWEFRYVSGSFRLFYALVPSPVSDTLWGITHDQVLFFSTDLGNSWQQAEAPADSGVQWVGYIAGRLFVAKKGGLWFQYGTWQEIPRFSGDTVMWCAKDPLRPDQMYVLTSRALWRGQPGDTWGLLLRFDELSLTSVAADPNGNVLITGVNDNTMEGVLFLSQTAGGVWDTIPVSMVPVGARLWGNHALVLSMGQGIWRGSLADTSAFSLSVVLEPTQLQVGDTLFVKVKSDRWLPAVPACSLAVAGETLRVELFDSLGTGTVFNGLALTSGLPPGDGLVWAWAEDAYGAQGYGEASFTLEAIPGPFAPPDSFYVYPNPAPSPNGPEKAYFNFYTTLNSKITLYIYDLRGREVARMEAEGLGGASGSVEWDLADVPSGLYLWRCRVVSADGSQEEELTGKVVVRK